MTLSHTTNKKIILMLILFVLPVSPLGIDLYSPSLPALANVFGTTYSVIQLSMTTFMVGFFIGELLIGTISDSLGRRKLMLIGLAAVCIISFMTMFSKNINTFLILRFFLGLTCVAPATLSKAIPAEVYDNKEITKVSSWIGVSWLSSFLIGPIAGGYLQYYFNWSAAFFVISIYSFIMFILIFLFLPETKINRSPFNIKNTLKMYKKILTYKPFLGGIFILGAYLSLQLIFNQFAPYIIQVRLGYSVIEYGKIALVFGIIVIAASLINTKLVTIFRPEILIISSIYISIATAAITILITYIIGTNLLLFLIPVIILFALTVIMFYSALGKILKIFPATAGIAAAMMGFLFKVEGTAVSKIGSLFNMPSACLFFIIILIVLFTSLIGYYMFKKHNINA